MMPSSLSSSVQPSAVYGINNSMQVRVVTLFAAANGDVDDDDDDVDDDDNSRWCHNTPKVTVWTPYYITTTTASAFNFYLTGQFFSEFSRFGHIPKSELFGTVELEHFMPKQQRQCIEGYEIHTTLWFVKNMASSQENCL